MQGKYLKIKKIKTSIKVKKIELQKTLKVIEVKKITEKNCNSYQRQNFHNDQVYQAVHQKVKIHNLHKDKV